MQSTEDWLGVDQSQARRLDTPRLWAVLIEPQVSPTAVVVVHVLPKYSPEVPVIEDDHMVEAFPTDRPDHPLDKWVLPWGSLSGPNLFDSQRCYPAHEDGAVDPVSIPDEILGGRVPGESLNDLLACPCRSRVGGDVEVDDLPPGVVQDEEDVEHFESRCRHGEEVDRDDVLGVIGQEGMPRLRWTMLGSDHVLRDRALADLRCSA